MPLTDEVKGLVEEWRSRPLDALYPVVFFDALRVNIRDEGHVSKKAVYLALAIRLDGQKELLGMWIERNEGSRFWTGILNELKNRGVQDILELFNNPRNNAIIFKWEGEKRQRMPKKRFLSGCTV
jgi:transposase-like protein